MNELAIDIFNVLGKKVKNIELNSEIFAFQDYNKQAIFDSLNSEKMSNFLSTSNTKNRSQVSGGGKKPWRQKGTGRARQGSIRSPQWKGGGVVFGPTKLKNNRLKLNKKIRKIAYKSLLTKKFNDKDILVIDKIKFVSPKTADFVAFLKNIKVFDSRKILLVTDKFDQNLYKSTRNIKSTTLVTAGSLNIYSIMNTKKIIFLEDSLSLIEQKII